MKINEAVILAGGLGTRLRSIVSEVPKPMAPVSQKPFLEYLLKYWSEQGIFHFVLSTGYLSEKIEAHFGKNWENSKITYCVEKKPQGTGGALVRSIEEITSENFLVLNGDTYCPISLVQLTLAHQKENADVTLVTHLGVHCGVAIVKKALFQSLPDTSPPFSLESDLMPYWKREGKKVAEFSFGSGFIDIGTPKGYSLFIDSIRPSDTLNK